MNNINEYVDARLRMLSDETYRTFQSPLVPTVAAGRIIGVRTPVLRRYAREFAKTADAAEFMKQLPHTSYDADNLHAFVIEQIKTFGDTVDALNEFLPYIDNWATCDMMSPKILATDTDTLLMHVEKWISSEHTYEVRFGILCLMRYYLSDNYETEILQKVVSITSDEYYINMARAWFFATALAKQWHDVLNIIKDGSLDTFTHNKTIQKAVESYRVTDEHKKILRELRRK